MVKFSAFNVKPGGTGTNQQGISGAKLLILPLLPAVVIFRGKMGGNFATKTLNVLSHYKEKFTCQHVALCEACNCRVGWLAACPSEVVMSAPYIYFMM